MIWVDITNLPHVLFFESFIKKTDTMVTTREFGGLTDLLDERGIEYTLIGKHGGLSKEDKLVESAKRVSGLTKIISGYNVKVAISKHSVELPRVAFGMSIPCIQVVDNEYAEAQNRLTLPLASKIVVPRFLDRAKIMAQGAVEERIAEFNGLCEIVHTKGFRPDKRVVEKFGLDDYILIRPEPLMAAYFNGKSMTQGVINGINKLGLRAVVMPRGNEGYKNAIVIKNADSLSLMYYAKAFVGGGGTMNREGALLGTPTISFYPQKLLGVDRFLIDRGLLFHAQGKGEIRDMLEEIVDNKTEFRRKARKLRGEMEDPFVVVNKEIERLTKD